MPPLVAGQAGQGLGARAARDGQRATQAALPRPGQERAEVAGQVLAVGDQPQVQVRLPRPWSGPPDVTSVSSSRGGIRATSVA